MNLTTCINCNLEENRINGNCTFKNAEDGHVARCGQPWVEKKMRILKLYNHLFTEGMKNKYRNLCYIDLYSGPGIYFDRTDGSEKPGSPLIAINNNFTHYFFNDIDEENIKAIDHRTRLNNNVKRYIKDANKVAKTINQELPQYSLGFCFVDPHNMTDLKFDTLVDISRSRKVDLLINFPYGSDYRRSVKYLMLEDSENHKFDDYFGTSKWRDIENKFRNKDDAYRAHALIDLYITQLKKLGYIKTHENERHSYIFPIYNSKNGLLYYLIYVSKHIRGYDFCKKMRPYAINQLELL